MTILLTITASLAGAAGAVAVWRMPGEVGPWHWLGPLVVAVVGLSAAGAVGLVALVGLVAFAGLGYFGMVHLAYVGFCVSVPIVGVALAARTAKARLPRWSAPLAAGLLLPVPLGLYATHIEPYRLGVDEVTYTIDAERAGEAPVRIGVLADLQTNNPGAHEDKAVDALLDAEPDIILIPGDLFQGSPSELARHLDDMRGLLSRLEAPGGVYFVYGDTDVWGIAEPILDGLDNIVVLSDELAEVSYHDRRIVIGGTHLHHRSEAAMAMVSELESAPQDDTIRILVAHRPDVALDLPEDSRVDLTVAGHTHGGQVVLPVFGPLVTMSDVPRQVARGGLHEVAGNDIYVSNGVGLERVQAPQVRFLSRPTVGVIDLVDAG